LSYISPEQVRNSHGVDTRSDLYSLGCTFYHVLTGRDPFEGSTLPEIVFKHSLDEAAPLANFRGDVPPGVQAIVRRLMAKRPEDRYQTPSELAEALQPFCPAKPPGKRKG